MLYTITNLEDGTKVATVFHNGELLTATSVSHGNIDDILDALYNGDDRVVEMFDLGRAVQKRFERVSERVLIANGKVLFDGEEVHNALTDQILRFVSEGVEDFKPLVNFFEKIATNPLEHSREQLYRFLERHKFTITPEGDFVGYKGVRRSGDGFTSITQGPAIVDGEFVNGFVPQPIGGVVEMVRNDVVHDPSVACSVGLHVGTYEYANTFGNGLVLECHVNPRDVVSVPFDHSDSKVRVCRYKVVKVIESKYESAYVAQDNDPDEEEVFYCSEGCGDEVEYDGDTCYECSDFYPY